MPTGTCIHQFGADAADQKHPAPGLAGTAFRALSSRCVTGPGVDPHSGHSAPANLGIKEHSGFQGGPNSLE